MTVLENEHIRKQKYNGEWWFVIGDVIEEVVHPADSFAYIKHLRRSRPELKAMMKGYPPESGKKVTPPTGLRFMTRGGRQQHRSWNVEGIIELLLATPRHHVADIHEWGKTADLREASRIANERLDALLNDDGTPKTN